MSSVISVGAPKTEMKATSGVNCRPASARSALRFPYQLVVLLLLFCGLTTADPCKDEQTQACKDLCPAGLFEDCQFNTGYQAVLCKCYKSEASPRTVADNPCTGPVNRGSGDACEKTANAFSGSRVFKCDGPTDELCVRFTSDDPPPTTTGSPQSFDLSGIIVFIVNAILVIVRTVVGTIRALIVSVLPIVDNLFSFIAETLSGVVDGLSL